MIQLSLRARQIEQVFIHCDAVYPEAGSPVHVRYAADITRLPEIAGRSLFESFGDLYLSIERGDDRHRLDAAFDLACLQNRFIEVLADNGVLPRHVTEIRRAEGLLWQQRLLNQRSRVSYPKRNDTRIRKAKAEPVNASVWIN